jgi:hypothetical protein
MEYLGLRNNQTWKIKNNEELDKLIKHENTVNCIKTLILSRFGHIQRKPEARATNKIFKWNPLTTRPRGRPKCRWEDNIIQGLGQMEIKNWLTCFARSYAAACCRITTCNTKNVYLQ